MTGHPAGPPMAECALPEMFGNKMVQQPDLVMVIGAEGVVGGALFYDLLRAEFNIRCLVRFEDESRIDRKPGVEFFYCDPLKGDIPESAFDGVKYVVNVASPLNSRSLPSDDAEAAERLNNLLITRSKARGISRYISLSSVNVSEVEGDGKWPSVNYHLEYSVINSGVPYTIFRPGILVGETNYDVIGHLAASGGRLSLFGKKADSLYLTPMKLLTEAVARALKTDQAANKTYSVALDSPVARKEFSRLIPTGRAKKSPLWDAEVQAQLSSSLKSGKTHPVTELELQPGEFEPRPQAA